MQRTDASIVPSVLRRAILAAAGLVACFAAASAFGQKGAGVSLPPGREAPGRSAGPQSAWVKSHESSVRLLAGAMPAASGGASVLYAGVELRLSEGWKTYWRHPGDDGGLPPTFDWSASRNLKSARVLYPAPKRLQSKTGTSIGYDSGVVFPVLIEPVDRARPVELALKLEYGICREICVPAEAVLQLVVEPGLGIMPAALASPLAEVPRPAANAVTAVGPPTLAKAAARLDGTAPGLTFDVSVGPAAEIVDLFVEAAGGVHLPMTAKVGEAKGGVQRFRIDLNGVEDAAKLAGQTLTLTITGRQGGTEVVWIVR